MVGYQRNDSICLPIVDLRRWVDVKNLIFGNIPGLKRFTPVSTSLSVGWKSFVHLCHTGNIIFSGNDLLG